MVLVLGMAEEVFLLLSLSSSSSSSSGVGVLGVILSVETWSDPDIPRGFGSPPKLTRTAGLLAVRLSMMSSSLGVKILGRRNHRRGMRETISMGNPIPARV